uniref:Uncharacterized protein n=1 Tax=Arundo donax TaxID=35708 RepID=A0A0A9ATB9_ARUDO
MISVPFRLTEQYTPASRSRSYSG